MSQLLGPTLTFKLARRRTWLSLGPAWAGLAGAAASEAAQFELNHLLSLLGLWLLVDPILGTLWELAVTEGLWRDIGQARLPMPPRHGFFLPYVQVGTPGARLVLHLRRYQRWWQTDYWPERGHQIVTFGWGAGLALSLSLLLGRPLFWLTLLALALICLAGQSPSDLSGPHGGRLQSIVHFLLPWAMGAALWAELNPLTLLLAICGWATYLGALRMIGRHQRADLLFWGGQVAALLLLLGLRSLVGAAILAVLLIGQSQLKARFDSPAGFLAKVQPYLITAVVVAGFALGKV